MSVFADTSALYAVLDADDDAHPAANAQWADLLGGSADLCASNYVIVETLALAQHRLGLDAVRLFQQDVMPVLRILWVDEPTHSTALHVLLLAGRRGLSLVDCVSLQLMRAYGIDEVFCFDPHFAEQGFRVLPERQGDAARG